MEIKIIITDAGAAGGSENISSTGGDWGSGRADFSNPGSGAMASSGGASGTGAGTEASMPAQGQAGAIDAGPAPAMGAFYQSGVPQAFDAQRAANVLPHTSGGATSTDESGGAAPGSGAGMETSTAEMHHG